jgi:hypothetical protein
MTTNHPRRALAEAEAAAWLELHADWSRGLPAEVRDTSVIGTETTSGDGRDLPWYRMDGAFTGSPAPRTDASVDRSPRGHRSHPLQGWGESVPSEPILDVPAAGEPLPLRGSALRAVGREDTEQLRPSTVVMGQRVPGALTYDRHVDQRGDRCMTHAMADLSGYSDASWMQQLAYDELISWLRLEAQLTDREIEALEQRAAGVAVTDRHCLARAQRRARLALA